MTPVVKSTYHKQRRRVPVSGLLAIWAVLASYDFNYRSLNGYWPAGSAATGSRGRTGSTRSLLFNRAAGIALQPFGASPATLMAIRMCPDDGPQEPQWPCSWS